MFRVSAEELKLWQNFYAQSLTIDGHESIVQEDGTKQLVLLPMLTYMMLSTMLDKLKYLPRNCFNRIVIETSICGLRPLTRTSPLLMRKLTEILRTLVDGVRKQHIQSVTMMFFKMDDINAVYDSYSIVFDYSMRSTGDELKTSVSTIAQLIHQIEHLLNWRDALPNGVELMFIVSALDQYENMESQVPKPFSFVKENVKNVYNQKETSQLLGRIVTPNGKIWLNFLPNNHRSWGSNIRSDLSPSQETLFRNEQKIIDKNRKSQAFLSTDFHGSTKSKKPDKKLAGYDLEAPLSTQPKKKMSLLSVVKSFITPSRVPTPITSSTPNTADIVLIHHTSTPKPGETASRITIAGNQEIQPLSAIYEISSPAIGLPVKIDSLTPSTLTVTDTSSEISPRIAVARRSTVRGQAAAARKKIASMQLEDDRDNHDDDDDEYDEEQSKRSFVWRKSRKSKDNRNVTNTKKKSERFSDTSIISLSNSNVESTFTPPTARKRLTADRIDDDDLAAELSTPPKTPRTSRRNRTDDSIYVPTTMMDTNDVILDIDSSRLLRSVAKKLQPRVSAQQTSFYEGETFVSSQSRSIKSFRDSEEMDCGEVNTERSSIARHYSMEESD